MPAQVTVAPASARRAPADAKEYVPYNDRFVDPSRMGGKWIKVKATIADLARKVTNHNMSRGFTSVLIIGDSGSGKTTCKKNLTHELHERHNYVIKNYHEEQILNIKRILHQLPKHQDYILVFDDVSFLIKKGKMKETDLMDMFHELTKVRHTVKGKVVAIFMIHYPYAIEKFMRQAGYRILTSITDDEREIYIKLFGGQWRRVIEQYIVDDRFQTEENRFNLPDPFGSWQTFEPKKPFKLALASRMGDLTYIVYQEINCARCEQDDDKLKRSERPLVEFLRSKGYESDKILRALKWHAYIVYGVNMLARQDRTCYNTIVDYAQKGNIDHKELYEFYKDLAKYKRKEKPNAEEMQEYIDDHLADLEAKIAERQKRKTPAESDLVKDTAKEPSPSDDVDDEEIDDQDDDSDDDATFTDKLEGSVMQQFGADQFV